MVELDSAGLILPIAVMVDGEPVYRTEALWLLDGAGWIPMFSKTADKARPGDRGRWGLGSAVHSRGADRDRPASWARLNSSTSFDIHPVDDLALQAHLALAQAAAIAAAIAQGAAKDRRPATKI